jgi:uncharacterized protein YjeT (DUF2065 family)
MPNPEPPAAPESLHQEKARLRKIGLIVLIAGLCGTGLVYWIGNRPEDPALADYRQAEARAETRQMEMLYGTSGDVMQKLVTAMKKPRNQALAIIGLTALISGACFYLGRPVPRNDEAS